MTPESQAIRESIKVAVSYMEAQGIEPRVVCMNHKTYMVLNCGKPLVSVEGLFIVVDDTIRGPNILVMQTMPDEDKAKKT